MASTFKNYKSTGTGVTFDTVYTVPASTASVVIGVNVANLLSEEIEVTVIAGGLHIVKDCPIPAGSALSPLEGKIILEETETVTVKCNRGAGCDVLVSVMEQT